MSYASHYPLADDVINHMVGVVPSIGDPFLQSRYAGFATIAATTVYELAVRNLLFDFAKNRDPVFYNYITNSFDKINAKIKIDHLNEYLKKFGSAYSKSFLDLIDFEDRDLLKTQKISLKSAYSNIITWRHAFAHSGVVSSYATFSEVVQNYHAGKTVIDCFYTVLFSCDP